MFEGLSKEEWIRWERVEHDFHAHPVLYRMRLAALFAEGLIVSIFLLAIIVLMVVVCVVNPLDNLRLIAFLVFNGFYTAVTYYRILTHRPWTGLPELGEKEWPRLHEFVRETSSAVGAPCIHRIFLAPGEFNAAVAVVFPLVPCMRRNVLVLGYPLLAALGVGGLRGVLAHELGHVAHRDTVHGGALLHVQAFWEAVELGVFTWALIPWRRSYLRRLDRLMSPFRRTSELAADHAIRELFGIDALRETLVSLELRGADADLEGILTPIAETDGASPAAEIRKAMRRELPAETIHRQIARALQSIVPPIEEHPPLAVRAGTADTSELIPYANHPQNALEVIFGGPDALDGCVDAALAPALTAIASKCKNLRAYAERHLAELPEVNASPDELMERFLLLRSLKRTDEAERLFHRARAVYPDSAALEAIELSEALADGDGKF
jgi:Zn-dependent protease with chaperone function